MLKNKILKNDKGMATVEMIPVIIVVALFLNYALGFYGVIHSGILNSIGARNYAFESFRNRSNLAYLRDVHLDKPTAEVIFGRYQARYHAIISETRKTDEEDFLATKRYLTFNQKGPEEDSSKTGSTRADNFAKIQAGVKIEKDDDTKNASPVWVRSGYGICLTAKCEQEN